MLARVLEEFSSMSSISREEGDFATVCHNFREFSQKFTEKLSLRVLRKVMLRSRIWDTIIERYKMLFEKIEELFKEHQRKRCWKTVQKAPCCFANGTMLDHGEGARPVRLQRELRVPDRRHVLPFLGCTRAFARTCRSSGVHNLWTRLRQKIGKWENAYPDRNSPTFTNFN